MSSNTQVAGHVVIGDWSMILARMRCSPVRAGWRPCLRRWRLAGRKDVPPISKQVARPELCRRELSWIKAAGIRHRTINHILDIYRDLQQGMNTSQAVEFIEEEMPATDGARRDPHLYPRKRRGIIKRYNPKWR